MELNVGRIKKNKLFKTRSTLSRDVNGDRQKYRTDIFFLFAEKLKPMAKMPYNISLTTDMSFEFHSDINIDLL